MSSPATSGPLINEEPLSSKQMSSLLETAMQAAQEAQQPDGGLDCTPDYRGVSLGVVVFSEAHLPICWAPARATPDPRRTSSPVRPNVVLGTHSQEMAHKPFGSQHTDLWIRTYRNTHPKQLFSLAVVPEAR
jgi:hypothetical protein